MAGELKSTLDIVMEKFKDNDMVKLNESQKERISKIKMEYKAKIAEKKILITDEALLSKEIVTLEERRDRDIEKIHQESK